MHFVIKVIRLWTISRRSKCSIRFKIRIAYPLLLIFPKVCMIRRTRWISCHLSAWVTLASGVLPTSPINNHMKTRYEDSSMISTKTKSMELCLHFQLFNRFHPKEPNQDSKEFRFLGLLRTIVIWRMSSLSSKFLTRTSKYLQRMGRMPRLHKMSKQKSKGRKSFGLRIHSSSNQFEELKVSLLTRLKGNRNSSLKSSTKMLSKTHTRGLQRKETK